MASSDGVEAGVASPPARASATTGADSRKGLALRAASFTGERSSRIGSSSAASGEGDDSEHDLFALAAKVAKQQRSMKKQPSGGGDGDDDDEDEETTSADAVTPTTTLHSAITTLSNADGNVEGDEDRSPSSASLSSSSAATKPYDPDSLKAVMSSVTGCGSTPWRKLAPHLPLGTPLWLIKLIAWAPLLPRVIIEFGYQHIGVFTAVYFLVKGVMVHLTNSVQLPLYKDVFHADSLVYQRLSTVTLMAWGMKPAIGLVSDAFPIRGYHKRYYMLAASLGCAILVFAVLFIPESWSGGATLAAVMLLGVNLGMATIDLLAEGKNSELLTKKPKSGPALVSFVWGCAMIGGTIAACVEGPLADSGAPRLALLLAVPMALMVAWPVAQNWLKEVPVTATGRGGLMKGGGASGHHRLSSGGAGDDDDEESLYPAAAVVTTLSTDVNTKEDQKQTNVVSRETHPPEEQEDEGHEQQHQHLVTKTFFGGRFSIQISHQLVQHWRITLYGLSVASGAIVMAIASTLGGRLIQFLVSVVVTIALSVFSFYSLPSVAAKANVFMFLKEVLYVQIPGVLDYFFVADERCVPGGPGFSYSYYQTFTSIIGYAAGALGVAAFNMWLSKSSLRVAFLCTTALKVLASLVDVLLVARWNIALAIPDSVMFIMGDAVVGNVSSMLDFMPAVILVAKLCPKGMEATMYAVLAGFSNFGQTISRMAGLMLTDAFGVIAEERDNPNAPGGKDACDFSRAPLLILLCHCLLPLLVVPLCLMLVPKIRADEDVSPAMLEMGYGGSSGSGDSGREEGVTTAQATARNVASRGDEGSNDGRGHVV